MVAIIFDYIEKVIKYLRLDINCSCLLASLSFNLPIQHCRPNGRIGITKIINIVTYTFGDDFGYCNVLQRN